MGLTRLAQDPWSESHTVPTFTPPPVEIKSCHVPLTAERAEELVKSHLERTGANLQRSRDQPIDPAVAADAGAGASITSTIASATPPHPANLKHYSYSSLSCYSNVGGSVFSHTQPLLTPSSSAKWLANGPAAVALLQAHLSGDSRPRQPSPQPSTPSSLGGLDRTGTGSSYEGIGGCNSSTDDVTCDQLLEEEGQEGMGDCSEADRRLPSCHKVLGATALMDAWMRQPEMPTSAEELTFRHASDADGGGGGGAVSGGQSTRPGSGQVPLSRRLSCPEDLLNAVQGGDGSCNASGGGEALEPEDALEPLANHHMWMYGRGRLDGGGVGLLYSPAGVLEATNYGDRVVGGWQPRNAASIFGADPWVIGPSGSVGGGGDAVAAGGAAEKITRIGKLVQGGAGTDVIRTLAAVIIQSYCRGWQARRRVERMKSLQRSEESRRLKERAAAEALAREQETVRRRLRAAAKDCLLAVQAQQDYERTRARLAAARGLNGGAAPPPPTISTALWERCKALGQDPIEVLLESGLQSHQIEEIIAASQLASQLPRRAAAAAARLGLPLQSVPEDSRPGTGHSRASYGGAASLGGTASSASDDSSSAAAAAALGKVAAAAAGRGMPSLMRRLSLPGRPLLSQRGSIGGAAAAPLSKQPQTSTSQLVDQLMAQQQPVQQLQLQQLSYGQCVRPASGSPAALATSSGAIGIAVRRSSGPGVLYGPGGVPLPPQPRRQASPSRGSAVPSADNSTVQRQGLYSGMLNGGGGGGGGFMAGTGPVRAAGATAAVAASQPQLQSLSSQPLSQQQQQGTLGRPRGSASTPLLSGIPRARRISDFVSGGVGSGSGGGTVAGMAAVGSAAMASPTATPPRAPVRVRSLGFSESGAVTASSSGGHLMLQTQLQPVTGRVVLPAVVPSAQPSAATAAVASGGGGVLPSLSSSDLRASDGGSCDSGGGGECSGGDGGGSGGVVLSAATQTPAGLTPPPPSQQQRQLASTSQHSLQYMPYHLQQHMLASALSSPVARSVGPQSSPGGSAEGSPALLRRHSFVERLGGAGGSAKYSPSSFSTGGLETVTATAGSPAALTLSISTAAATASAASRGGLAGGSGGGGSPGFPAQLPPLLLSQGSGSFGGSSGTPSPSAAATTAASAAAAAAMVAANGSGVAPGDFFLLRATRSKSNLAPQVASPPRTAVAAPVAVASPQPGPPPTATSCKSFRRLQSLTQVYAAQRRWP